MEYSLGFTLGCTITFVAAYAYRYIVGNPISYKPHASQSRSHRLMAPVTFPIEQYKQLYSQSSKFYDSHQLRILYTNDNAYWIENNSVYKAKVENNLVIENSEEKLDILSMNDVELEEVMFIVEKLTEGLRDDRWNPGNK